MTSSGPKSPGRTRKIRAFAIIGVVVLCGGILAANAHLVYVAVSSQPECAKPTQGDTTIAYRAAKPGC